MALSALLGFSSHGSSSEKLSHSSSAILLLYSSISEESEEFSHFGINGVSPRYAISYPLPLRGIIGGFLVSPNPYSWEYDRFVSTRLWYFLVTFGLSHLFARNT